MKISVQIFFKCILKTIYVEMTFSICQLIKEIRAVFNRSF